MTLQLGRRAGYIAGTKDATHVAIIAVHTQEGCRPGDYVTITENDVARKVSNPAKALGILDPFARPKDGQFEIGAKVWVLVRPDLVTGLRHDWGWGSLPGCPDTWDEDDEAARSRWCQDSCAREDD